MRYLNKHNLRPAYVEALTTDNYDYQPDVMSSTFLINPPYKAKLTRLYADDLVTDVTNNAWKVYGTAIHSVLETEHKEYIVEKRFYADIDVDGEKQKISSKIDVYDIENASLEDFKSTSSFMYKNGVKPAWEQQLNINAYILTQNDIPVNQIYINALFRDWKHGFSKEDMPPTPCHSFPVTLWSEEQQLAFIKERIKLHQNHNPDVCSKEERWSEDVFKVFKPNAKRATRVFKSYAAAQIFTRNNASKGPYEIRTVEGEDKRCHNYCEVNYLCKYYKEKHGTD